MTSQDVAIAQTTLEQAGFRTRVVLEDTDDQTFDGIVISQDRVGGTQSKPSTLVTLFVGRFEYGPRGVLDETHVHLFTPASFRREVERGGFRVLGERVTALPFEIVFQSTGKSRFVRALSRVYHWIARAWPEMFAYQFLLEAEVTTLLDEGS